MLPGRYPHVSLVLRQASQHTSRPPAAHPTCARRAGTCKGLASLPALPGPPLDPSTCFLLSRKWPAYLAGSLYRLFTDCTAPLRLLRPDACHSAPPFRPPKRYSRPLSAQLPKPEVLPASPSACNQVGLRWCSRGLL